MKISEIFKKTFWQDKKNVAIAILVVLLFIMPIGQTTNNNELNTLKEEISSLENTISSLEKQLTDLKSKNTDLEKEKQTLESEKVQLTTKIEELEKTSFTSSTTTSSTTQSSTNNAKTSTETSTTSATTNSEMVWVGDAGTKYHIQSCRTLKGNGHQITMQQALAEGRTACKVCH